jgi:putative Ca2+/H+ antiporter (TMEM165/GDT1 family)
MYFVQEITPKNNLAAVGNVPQQPTEATQAFYPSVAQSFLVIFLSEIADRTFILVLIYSLKMHWIPLLVTSLLAMYFMNILAIVAGYTVILLIPRSVLDWIGFFCFLLFGVYSVYEGMQMESKSVKEEYEEEMSRGKNENTGDDYALINDEGRHEDTNKQSLWLLCLELFGFLCLSEFGDKSEISTVTITAIYNVYGVLIGTMLAYLAAISIAAFLGISVGKFLTEKMMTIIGGFLFIGFAIQILIIKLFF